MKIPKEDVGKVVTIELGRPIYIIDYAAHVKWPDGGKGIIGQPVMASKDSPVAMNVLIGVRVKAIGEDSVSVEMLTPDNNISLIKVADGLIVACTEIIEHNPEKLPEVTKLQTAPASRLIL